MSAICRFFPVIFLPLKKKTIFKISYGVEQNTPQFDFPNSWLTAGNSSFAYWERERKRLGCSLYATFGLWVTATLGILSSLQDKDLAFIMPIANVNKVEPFIVDDFAIKL